MNNELNIRICGQAGQGMQTIGAALGQAFRKAGYHLFAIQDYMSRVRGGNNFFQLRISTEPIFTLRQKADIVIALDKESAALHHPVLRPQGVLVADKAKFNLPLDKDYFDVPLYSMAQAAGNEIFINTVACGAVLGIIDAEFKYLEQVIGDTFKAKGQEMVDKNIQAARAGYDFARANFKKEKLTLAPASAGKSLLLNGNDAIALGAIKGGCKFYSAYPMSPSTTILDVMAYYSKKFNFVVEQAEDEIAAINMALGASYAGARAMTASSGGGFALMVEGVSLAGMTETPVVIGCISRPGPATGFPTRTEQADMDFLISCGHGEFARLIYSPGSIEEAFYLTQKAFNLAEQYQIPVFILSDQHLADSYRDVEPFDLEKIKNKRWILSKEESAGVSQYKRYALNESGISPRAVPGWIQDVVYADSDEHSEEGHITEDAGVRVKMVEKRFYKKMAALEKEIQEPTVYNLERSRIVLLGFGSTLGVLKETCAQLKDAGFVHFSQVWPFPGKRLLEILQGRKNIYTVENNAGAQLAGLIRRQSGFQVDGSILRFDGRPFDLDGLVEEVQKRMK